MRSRLRGLSEKLDHRVCPTTIGRLLRDQKLGLRSHRKVLHTGKHHAERDTQFRKIASQREEFRLTGDPRVSVDTKKKELIGQFANSGQTWCTEGEKVNDHDFPSDAEARVVPYGIYDPERNTGHVCVSTSKDVPDFAVDALCDWWKLNAQHYRAATRLMIEADSGGSNAARSRRYKQRLQEFADETGLEISVCHYPPGTSKWNPIEHRLFSQISATWRGYVLRTVAIVLSFIRRTTTRTGLAVTSTRFEKVYETGVKVSKAEFKSIQLTRHDICPQWNYTIRPHPKNTK
ncbi:MAG TPA: ISAzo13 family transposase [Gammaproteobacteria bacterium]|nr:ISAzo13 family transposase [Gammaproteobacteria bacterium]